MESNFFRVNFEERNLEFIKTPCDEHHNRGHYVPSSP